MKFYVIIDEAGEVCGCETSLADAMTVARSLCFKFSINMVDVAVTADNMRRLLGNQGGYSKSVKYYEDLS
jgi:hypothetical protein